MRFHLTIARDHLGTAFAEACDIEHSPRGSFFSMGLKAPPQFIEPHQAHFCVAQSLEVQQVFKLIFELIFHFFEL